MKKQFVKYFISAGLIVIFSAISNYVLSQNTGGAVKLEYNYPEGKEIRYLSSGTMAMKMDIEGQTMQNDVTNAFGCTVKSAGKQDKMQGTGCLQHAFHATGDRRSARRTKLCPFAGRN